MTIEELIKGLQELPQDAKVVVDSDGQLVDLSRIDYVQNEEVYERVHPGAVSFAWRLKRVNEVRLGG